MAEPKIDAKININLTEIVIAIGILVGISFLIWSWIKSNREKVEREKVSKLFAMDIFTKDGAAHIVQKIPKPQLKTAQTKLNSIDVSDIGDLIEGAEGTFNDDEESVYDAFSNCKTQLGVASMASYFNRTYKKPLLNYIQSFMDNSDLARVYDTIMRLPIY